MPETRLNEPIIGGVQQLLTDGLPAALAARDTGLPVPVEILPYMPPVVMITDYPTIGIGDAPWRIEDDNAHSWTVRADLLVVVHLQDADPEALSWALRRYVQAMLEVVSNDRTLAGTAFGADGWRGEPGPMLSDNPDKPQQFMAWSGFSFWAKVDED